MSCFRLSRTDGEETVSEICEAEERLKASLQEEMDFQLRAPRKRQGAIRRCGCLRFETWSPTGRRHQTARLRRKRRIDSLWNHLSADIPRGHSGGLQVEANRYSAYQISLEY